MKHNSQFNGNESLSAFFTTWNLIRKTWYNVEMIQRIYIDISVIGGCFDNEFTQYSTRLFEEFASGDKKLIISDIVLLELEEAPPEVRGCIG